MNNKNILIFYSNTNTAKKSDATGAFIPEAKAFARLHSVPQKDVIGVKCPHVAKAKRRKKVLDAIDSYQGKLDCIAFFGHGWPQGIQFGFDRSHIPQLCKAMKFKCKKDVKLALYACLTAENDARDARHKSVGPCTNGGFADELRDQMARDGMNRGWVDAHKTAGHTTFNPFVVRFLCSTVTKLEDGAKGGAWIVEPASQMWAKWKYALKNGSMRKRFVFMTELEIKNELAQKRGVD